MRQGIGLGVGINRSNYAQGIFNAYSARVVADGGVVESGSCVDAVSSLLQSASLLLIPSGYKGGKLYSEIPTNGNGDFTWTRASDAWRTNADGLIQRVPWNLLQRSEEFDNAVWTANGVTVVANTAISPSGLMTADKVIPTNISSAFKELQQSISITQGVTYTFSQYVKSDGYQFVQLIGSFAAFGDFYVNYDLVNGVETAYSQGTSNIISRNITNIGNGWYRISVSAVALSTTTGRLLVDIIPTFNSVRGVSWTGNGTSGILFWGAQLVEGTTAQTYLPTTDRLNFPRLSYMYGSCPSALLEPQRTNLALYSDQFNDASWLKNNTTITANQETSPDGTQNADLLSASSGATAFLYRSFTLTAGTSYTFSIYVKKKTVTSSSNRFRINFVNNLFVDFSGSVPVITSGSGSIQNAANGFYRIITTVTTSVASNVLYIYPDGNNGSADEFYIYGAQLEAGAYATTYIPTTSATATRVADECSKSGISSLIGQSEGSIFFEVYFTELTNAQFRVFFCLEGSVSSQFSGFVVATTNNGNDVSYAGTNYSLTTGRHKVVCTYSQANNQRKLFVDGVLRGTSTHTNFLSTIDRLSIGCRINPFSAFQSDRQLSSNSEISKFAVFNSLLTDTQCQTLTT